MEEPKRVPFGDYMPDLAKLANSGLAVANNTIPVTGGYDGVKALGSIAGFTAIDEFPRGSIAGIDRSGNPYNFVGTETKLWALRTDTEEVTRTTGAYNCAGDLNWEFTVFGKHIIAVNPSDESQYFTLSISDNFKRLGNPDTTNTIAPRAKTVGVVGTFVMMGNTYDGINGIDESAVHWSALNDPFNWPDPGTDVALAVQSGRQSLAGAGGAVQRVISGAEVTAIFQERAVWRADYRGGDVMFEFNRVEPNRGLLIPAFAVPFGRHVFYLSEDGFYLFDYTTSIPIGHDIIDQTFLADVDTEFSHRCSATVNPDAQQIWMLYPGSGHDAAGTPNKYVVWDWTLGRFAHGDLGDVTPTWITQMVDPGLHLDSPGIVGDPNDTTDDPAYPLGGVDGPDLPSFDARITAPGGLKLGVWLETAPSIYSIRDFSGSVLAATLETGRREIVPGYRSLASRARLMVDSVDPTIEVAGLSRTNETEVFSQPSRIDADGDAPFRVDGRYHVFRVNLPTGWSKALGMDVFAQRSGRR
jgi:hypothetical protein